MLAKPRNFSAPEKDDRRRLSVRMKKTIRKLRWLMWVSLTLNVLTTVTLVVCVIAFRDYAASRQIRDEWMPRELKKLQRFRPDKRSKTPEVRTGTYKDGVSYYHIRGGDTLFCANDEWIHFAINSMHTDNFVGDISLAVTSTGKFYSSSAHICPSLVIPLPSEAGFASIDEFLDAVPSDIGRETTECAWKEYDPGF